MSEKTPPDVVRWYTRARKFPQLIGRTPDGAKLWGGPYTITQAVGAGLTLFVGLNTMSLWASFGFLGNFLVLGVATYGVVLGLGRIPVGSRSPLSVASGAYKAVTSPAYGRLGGRPVRLRRPRQLRHTVVIRLDTPAESTEVLEVVAEAARPTPARGLSRRRPRRATAVSDAPPSPTPDPAPGRSSTPGRPALTGVQSLLAGAGRLPRSETS